MFEPDHMLEVEIELPAAEWDTLRTTTRSLDVFFGSDCLDQPFESPFQWTSATVTVDGTRLEDVAIRKKGFFGSLDTEKPSLKLEFDELVPDQRLSGLERMTLNNAKQDASYIRQCIGYQVFAAAGIPAPRCNFAHVTVNGDDLGLYVHVETVKKAFLARHFEDNDGPLYEGTLSDFRAGWTGTFDIKANEEVAAPSDIDGLVTALEASDSSLVDRLDPVVDVDEFLTFWATEALLAHWDGYSNNANNFYIYRDPTTDRLSFIPWGADGILFDANAFPAGEEPPKSVFGTGLLARRLYLLTETRDRYIDIMRGLLDTVWVESELLAEVDRMEALIEPVASNDPFLGNADLATEIDEVRTFIRDRRDQLEPELDAPPVWDYPLRDSFCFAEKGMAQGTFSTTFGTIAASDPFATGTGSLGGTVDGTAITPQQVGSKAGFDPDEPQNVQVQLVAQMSATRYLLVVLSVNASSFASGASLPLDLGTSLGFMLEFEASTGAATIVGLVAGGTIELDAAGLGSSTPVTGSFSAKIVQSPF